MHFTKATFISLLIHLSLLALLSKGGGKGSNDGATQEQHKPITVNVIEKNQQDKIKEEKPKDGTILVKKIKKKKKKKVKEIDCKDYYTGIGVQTEWASCTVSKVFQGYPAEQNGVLAGDLIVSPPCHEIIGPEGTTINLVIMRGTKAVHLSFKRGKICEQK